MARSLGLPAVWYSDSCQKTTKVKSAKPHRRTRNNHHHEIHRQRRDRMGGNQTGLLRLGGILSNAKRNQSPRRNPEPHPTESANPGTPAPGTTHRPATQTITQAKGKSSIGGSMADETSANLFWQHFGRIARKVAIYGSPLWTLLIICGLLLAIKAIALARSRKHGSTQQRVAAGWQSVAALARQSGLDIRGTRSEQAVSIANQMDISRRDLARFGRASRLRGLLR